MRIAVWDMEVANSPDEVAGGWDNKAALGISSGVVWASWLERFLCFRAERTHVLVDVLQQADVVVGFNSVAFDDPLLAACGYPLTQSRDRVHCDLMLLCERPHRRRVSLDELAYHTLGRGKTGHGQHAPDLARDGRWDELFEYNITDVALTRDLFLFARQYGYLLDSRERIAVCVPGGVPRWHAKQPSISQDPATVGQIKYMQGLVHGWMPTPGLTKQQASQLIERAKSGAWR